MNKQPYLYKPWIDIGFICMPAFICLAAILIFPNIFQNTETVNQWWWLLVILGIDVTHVYTTLYKTYANKNNFNKHKTAFTLIPILCFVTAFLVFSFGAQSFWTVIAYTAVFHFIRQQYGFMRLFSRNETSKKLKLIDTIAIYAATVYPLLYWHCKGPFEFSWFTPTDFFFLKQDRIAYFTSFVYYAIACLWVFKEIYTLLKFRYFNIPKFLIILGTFVSWYFGIVYFENDLTFTLFNVVSHGIPYMALVWIDQAKETSKQPFNLSKLQKFLFVKKNPLLFLLIPFTFAFVEEFLWNTVLWHESKVYFAISSIRISSEWKSIIIPLLILPQLTHYVIDGFVWKISKGHVST